MKYAFHFLILLCVGFLGSCGSVGVVRNTEARDDAEEYSMAQESQRKFENKVLATAQTDPVDAEITDDSADDPAIWYNSQNPSKSIVFGSNKKKGIHSYTLSGQEIQFVPTGRVNNIDIRHSVKMNDAEYDILGASNRTTKSIDIYIIDHKGRISSAPDFSIGLGDFKPYGFCLSKTFKNELNAFVNDKKGNIYQFHITLSNREWKAEMIRKLKLDSQIEGMVVDDVTQLLYVGEEQVAIHIFDIRRNGNMGKRILKGSTAKNEHIRFDIEGLSIFRENGRPYLIASSQGSFSYAIFDLKKEKYLTSFIITDGATIDGVEETDGLDILNLSLGDKFPYGILVVQDGFNYENGKLAPQNFKFVPLENFKNLLIN